MFLKRKNLNYLNFIYFSLKLYPLAIFIDPMFPTSRSLFDEAYFCQTPDNSVFLSPQRSRTSVSRATRRLFGRRACRSSSRSECCGTELRQRSSTLSPRIGPPSTITWLSGPRPKSREITSTKKVTQKKNEQITFFKDYPFLFTVPFSLPFSCFLFYDLGCFQFFFLLFLFLAVFYHLILNVLFYFIKRIIQGIKSKFLVFS